MANNKGKTQPPLFIGLLTAAGVVVLGLYALDFHAHRCEACGHRWRHLGAFNLGDPASHTCAKCSTVQWWKDGVPHVFREVLRTPPPDTYVTRMRQLSESAPSLLGGGIPALLGGGAR